MGILSKIAGYPAAVKNYITKNFDHFMISLGVSVVVTLITNVFLFHLGYWLHLFRIPLRLIHWLGYK